MGQVKEQFYKIATKSSEDIKKLIKENGETVIGEIKLSQIYHGMRGIIGLVTETSLLDANEGIRFRGFSIPELIEKLPKAEGGSQPLPEGLFHLMLLGEIPSQDDVDHLSAVLARRSHVPNYVFDAIESLPLHTHPMTQFSIAIMALQTESLFAKAYNEGINKKCPQLENKEYNIVSIFSL